ncbi:Crp/Fnr family transcriptional regulator [Fibrella aquatilis]|uniref:Crp/Fnr family transcriptional regulator n=1 Tax=Fibrella aquatilis TaxID=2817059 RepID=A0A939JXV7_9BACT|nr:Crp/Fnr family transcriptional regulator [Fibrella aquatilis]MBO0931434.1 Crp/Fnr family transcriptional regulator [Fibrella aquatilis]
MTPHPLRVHLEQIAPLTDGEFDYILGHFMPRAFRRHQFVVQEGMAVPGDFFVVKGCLRAYHTASDGKESILQFATENWWVTDYDAYYRERPATISIDCIEPCELLCLSLLNREKLCAELRGVEHFFRKKSNAGYVALQQRILSLLTTNAAERYEQFAAQYPHLLQRLPKTMIAAYLGVSRETLSRL